MPETVIQHSFEIGQKVWTLQKDSYEPVRVTIKAFNASLVGTSDYKVDYFIQFEGQSGMTLGLPLFKTRELAMTTFH